MLNSAKVYLQSASRNGLSYFFSIFMYLFCCVYLLNIFFFNILLSSTQSTTPSHGHRFMYVHIYVCTDIRMYVYIYVYAIEMMSTIEKGFINIFEVPICYFFRSLPFDKIKYTPFSLSPLLNAYLQRQFKYLFFFIIY